MDETSRMVSTVFVWIALAVSVGLFFGIAPAEMAAAGTIIIAILALVAWASTRAIWQGARSDAEPIQDAEKTKRSNRERIGRLVEALDEDEIVELETLLLAREDGPPRREAR